MFTYCYNNTVNMADYRGGEEFCKQIMDSNQKVVVIVPGGGEKL